VGAFFYDPRKLGHYERNEYSARNRPQGSATKWSHRAFWIVTTVVADVQAVMDSMKNATDTMDATPKRVEVPCAAVAPYARQRARRPARSIGPGFENKTGTSSATSEPQAIELKCTVSDQPSAGYLRLFTAIFADVFGDGYRGAGSRTEVE
jgi:hypothetical protein